MKSKRPHFDHVADILAAYKAGDLTDEQTIDQLATFHYLTPSRFNQRPSDPFDFPATEDWRYDEPDTFDEVRRALATGILPQALYMAVVRAINIRPRMP